MVVKNRKWEIMVAGAVAAAVLGSGCVATSRADITNGFSNSSNWTLNGTSGSTSQGVPAMSGGDLTLTDNFQNEDSSAWYNTQQNISNSWTASFTYQMSYTSSFPSVGFMFVLQSAGTNALGAGGSGQLGYQNLTASQSSSGAYSGFVNVDPSWGLGFQLFGHGASSFLQLGQNGVYTAGTTISNSTTNKLIMSRDQNNPINFTISYYQPDGVVSISAADNSGGAYSGTLNYNIQLPGPYNMIPTPPTTLASDLGQNTAYVGFTGATAGDTVEQDFTNFSFTSGTPTSPPSGYTAPTPAPAFVTVPRAPIALTAGSFNADVVVENTASLPAGATVSSSIATPAGNTTNALYEAGVNVNGTAVAGGLPTSHQFLSQADGTTTFQLQHYTNTNNVLRLSSATGGITSGTITLSQPTTFSTLAILAMSAGAKNNSVGAMTLNFANGQSVTTDYAAPDWFSGTDLGTTPDGNPFSLALGGLGRITVTKTISSTSVNGLPSYPGLYETALNISHLGTDSTGNFVDASGYGALDSITFNLASSASVTELFAISGSAAVPEPAPLAIFAVGGGLGLLLIGRKRTARRKA
ncbi:MAG: L-type lectin family protein [Phycisphaerae bacterium]